MMRVLFAVAMCSSFLWAQFKPDAASFSEPPRNYDLEKITLHLKLDVDQSRFEGSVTNQLRPLFDGVQYVRFDCVDLDIQRVALDGKQLAFTPFDDKPRKGIEVDLGYETRLLLTSRWEGNIQLYYPIDTIIDYTVRLWPESTDEKIINLQINYFSIDQAFRAIHRRFENLNNTSLLLMDKSYTMENPETYFKIRYLHSNWF